MKSGPASFAHESTAALSWAALSSAINIIFMANFSFKIAYPMIIAGLFVIVAFMALNYQNLSFSYYVIFAFLAIYVFFFGIATGQRFSAPIKGLLKKADDLSKGDVKSRAYLGENDEIGKLAETFNKIAQGAEESKSKNESFAKSAEAKIKTNKLLMEQLINSLEEKVRNRTLQAEKNFEELEKFQKQLQEKETKIMSLEKEVQGLQGQLAKKQKRKPKTIS